MDKVNIRRALDSVTEYWSQEVVGLANGSMYKVAKGKGETHWHKHDDQDELFILYDGHMTVHFRDRAVELRRDDMLVVPKGVEHKPVAHGEAAFLIVGLNITSTPEGGKPEG